MYKFYVVLESFWHKLLIFDFKNRSVSFFSIFHYDSIIFARKFLINYRFLKFFSGFKKYNYIENIEEKLITLKSNFLIPIFLPPDDFNIELIKSVSKSISFSMKYSGRR